MVALRMEVGDIKMGACVRLGYIHYRGPRAYYFITIKLGKTNMVELSVKILQRYECEFSLADDDSLSDTIAYIFRIHVSEDVEKLTQAATQLIASLRV